MAKVFMFHIVIKYCLLNSLVLITLLGYAQQQPMYTQYMFNGLVLNPAYAGSQETFTATALFRAQWAGIENSPQTQTFSAHSPLDKLRNKRRPDSKVSLGITVFNDHIAITDQTGMLASYAYRVKLLNNMSLSLGLQAGVSQFRIKYSELMLDDPAFATGDIIEWKPDFGAGVYFQTERFYVGLSSPQIMQRNMTQVKSSLVVIPHYFLTMGYIFNLGYAARLKPNVLIKSVQGDNLQLDVNCNLFLNELINLGISWRSMESIGTLLQLQVHNRFAIGYAYDVPYRNELSRQANGSHEFMINYHVPNKKKRTINPRYF